MSMKSRATLIIVVLTIYYTTLEVVKILGHLIIVHRLDGASQANVVRVGRVRKDTTDGEVAVVDRARVVVKVGIIITIVDRVVEVHRVVVGAHGHRVVAHHGRQVVRVERRDRDRERKSVSKEEGE